MKSKHKFSNKELLEEVVKKSLSKAQVLKELDIVAAGGNYKTLNHYIKLYNINISHFTGAAWNQGERFKPFCKKADLKDILIENSTYRSTNGLRKKLINEGIKKHKCEKCNLEEWNNLPIPLELDHINGINTDNRIENLQILCPNCHAQTDTYRGKNLKSGDSKRKYNRSYIPKKAKEKKLKNICKSCNKATNRKSFCSYSCMYEYNSRNIPLKEDLLTVIEDMGTNFSALGRHFGVSDNTVRKWFLKYDLI